MGKKIYNEKLNNSGDLPKIQDLIDKSEVVKRMVYDDTTVKLFGTALIHAKKAVLVSIGG